MSENYRKEVKKLICQYVCKENDIDPYFLNKYLNQIQSLIDETVKEERKKILDLESMLMRIYNLDKTPMYSYKGKESLTAEECAPIPGQRWMTPREIIRQYFGTEFWDKYHKLSEGEE